MGAATDIQNAYFDAIMAADFDRIREMYHPDYEFTDEEGVRHGIEGSLAKIRVYTDAFPGFTFEKHRQLDLGDVALMEATVRGVHSNDLRGVPATGRPVEMAYCNVMEIRDGRIYREHDYSDNLSLMRQLGVLEGVG
ncbi:MULTISPECIES: ester cyclase [unclassified Nocardiopsis]|uniref:ester cyclase n=1 Tax=unclassified Nocardiopsis TaxID=2649073 RepID=UPI001359DF20|nr:MULTISPECIES: ester cyclase [unclassified Nocardiopsis]